MTRKKNLTKNALKKEKSLKKRKNNRASLDAEIIGAKIVKPKPKKKCLIKKNVKNVKEEELISEDDSEDRGFKDMKAKEKAKIVNMSKNERIQIIDNDDVSEDEYESLLKSMKDLKTSMMTSIKEETKSDIDKKSEIMMDEDNVIAIEEDKDILMDKDDNDKPKRTIYDVIKETYDKKKFEENKNKREINDKNEELPWENEKVLSLYEAVGVVLKRYKSNTKLPTPVTYIIRSKYWEELLFLTNPQNWSDHAYGDITRMFLQQAKQNMIQRYLNLILLPKIRIDLKEKKKISQILYQTLIKCCCKSGAFFKGLLLPLCSEGGKCTLREAITFGSICQKNRFPVLHLSLALLRLADMHYTNTVSYFMRTLLHRNYPLPYKVVDGIVEHFMRFEGERYRKYPLVWYQALLVFLQNYKIHIQDEDIEELKTFIQRHSQNKIVLEILQELRNKQKMK